MKNFFISIPHSGEEIPPEAIWLHKLEEKVLLCDVDRYVDRLYKKALTELKIPHIIAKWHRYAVDLNRNPNDIHSNSVEKSSAAESPVSEPFSKTSKKDPHTEEKKNLRGLHWVFTTQEFQLIKNPLSFEKHKLLLKKYYFPYHEALSRKLLEMKKENSKVYLLDAHSMPSKGTNLHRDPGKKRAEIVLSDQDGKSAEKNFSDLVFEAFRKASFKVVKNWPYKGGYITKHYGKPHEKQNAVQVEMNRALYMNEETKKKLPEKKMTEIEEQIKEALQWICKNLKSL